VFALLFALKDYVDYRLQRRRYSPLQLTDKGWKLATAENFLGANEAPAGCYFVMHTRVSLLSWLIMYVTQSAASHAGIYIGHGEIVDATMGGVVRHPLEDYLDGRSWISDNRKEVLTDGQRAGIVKAALSTVDVTPYGWVNALRIGWQKLFGSRSGNRPNRRLQMDTITLAFLPAAIAAIFTGSTGRLALIPGIAWLTILVLAEIWHQRSVSPV
jgi:hypothetical protein